MLFVFYGQVLVRFFQRLLCFFLCFDLTKITVDYFQLLVRIGNRLIQFAFAVFVIFQQLF